MTVGVIATRGQGDQTRDYLRRFVTRLGLAGLTPVYDSGHLTRCRDDDSPLRRGRVLVAGDAAGLLEPWTREGISFALRSGALAGTAAARGELAGYPQLVQARLGVEMSAGRELLAAFRAHPGLFHAMLATPLGWRVFTDFCRGRTSLDRVVQRRPVRLALSMLRSRRRSGHDHRPTVDLSSA